MIQRLVLAVLLVVIVVPQLPAPVREDLTGVWGVVLVLLGLMLVEFVARVLGLLRAPRVRGPRVRVPAARREPPPVTNRAPVVDDPPSPPNSPRLSGPR